MLHGNELEIELPAEIVTGFAEKTKTILGDNLVGVYLHGSAAMGCYHPEKSDLDFIVVVKHEMSKESKRAFMDMVVAQHAQTPGKGIEMSVVLQKDCRPFAYATPFELHFSERHLKWYQEDPEDYVQKMIGADKDLAAHFTVIRARGRCLCGLPIDEVFGGVPEQDYLDALWYDIGDAPEEIAENTMYLTLNLARVLAYLKEKKVLSKQEGGEWGLRNLPKEYHGLLREALREYQGAAPVYDMELAKEYAEFMLSEIRKQA